MKNISLAVVGPGLIGSKHIELINKNSRCHLKAIVAQDNEHDKRIAVQFGVQIYFSLDELLAATDIDGVIISSPNIYHVEQALRCIEAGLPVLVEKPIAHSYNEGLRLLNAVEKTSAKLIVGHHRSYSPIIETAKTIIQDNTLGKIVAIMGSAMFYKPDAYFESGIWRKEIGGGPILINLIHEIGNYRSLCGEISAVHAFSSNANRKFIVEDTVSINFQFTSGALGTFLLSDTAASAKSWEQTSQENSSYPNYPDEDCYVVAGTHGSLAIPSMHLRKYNNANEQSWWIPFESETISFDRKDPLECQLNHFLNVIEGREKPIVSAYDGLQNLKVTEAIQKSAKTNKTVYL